MPTKSTRAVPEGYSSVTPYLIVNGVAGLIDFLTVAFGGEERFRVPNDDGTIGHAEVRIGDSVLMTFDARPDWPHTPSFLTLWTDDCDAAHHAALAAGAIVVTELTTNAWGDRGSRIRDPFGNLWWIQTHVEDVSDDEIARRMSDESHHEHMRDSAETLNGAMHQVGRDRDAGL